MSSPFLEGAFPEEVGKYAKVVTLFIYFFIDFRERERKMEGERSMILLIPLLMSSLIVTRALTGD